MRGDLQECYFALPDANFLSSWCQFQFSRAQNRGFCALLPSGTPVFGHFEHKIGVFVLFWASGPPFSGISSTKSGFLCFFTLRNPHFRAFRAQNRHFCALLPSEPPVFGYFGKRLRDYVSAIKRKQGVLPCYSFVHLSGRRSRYASEFEPGGKAAVLLSTSDR